MRWVVVGIGIAVVAVMCLWSRHAAAVICGVTIAAVVVDIRVHAPVPHRKLRRFTVELRRGRR
ncbi:MAG: hypothetical protein ABI867_40440 [Kofleriaceae bacterium]